MFKLTSKYKPTGDQPEAINKLAKGLKSGKRHQVLLGVTGSGKTFTMAKVIEAYQKPTLIISHNKTLAAQLYKEFKEFFPKNAVHYFVSYYDYYQPEAYIPHTDTYIEKDSKINEELDRLRHATTQALMSRNDVIIIASVSCIYNLGSPEEYKNMGLNIFEGQKIKPDELVRGLIRLQYTQDIELKRGCFRKTRNEIELMGPDGQNVFKITLGSIYSQSSKKNKFTPAEGIVKIMHADITEPDELETEEPKFEKILEATILPAKYWLTSDNKIAIAIENIKGELQQTIKKLKKAGKIQEAARLYDKTMQDIDMMRKTGYCHGIENYSRHLDFRKSGEPPYTLIDFFISKGEFLTIMDESHISIPQIRGMFHGDHSRKTTLVNYGWRLPSALDNRPLKFEEFNKRIQKTIYVSATPGKYEIEKAGKTNVAEQLVRPTGLLDPTIEIRPTKNQIEHLLEEIKKRIANKERIITTTLTKRMAEDLSEYLADAGIKVNYLHSEIKTLERLKILKDFRLGHYDVIVGVNLLREGLDIPEVSLIAILDADKEGFLRNTTTLIQTMGRAARHVNGHVIMYADKRTNSIKSAMYETMRRRKKQEKYNTVRGITPTTIKKAIDDFDLPISQSGSTMLTAGGITKTKRWGREEDELVIFGNGSRGKVVAQLTKMMERAARKMEYDRAMALREQIRKIKNDIA
ncbi:MAG: excinuclease ABC subunit B [Candidatus Yanofskybacteria bacterium RIFCSPHIGHO2_02_FULL_41_29]|uniref:UvrABC system protein B n=1 Tax=Candidatus Yanofskybacteria bacterium RIFCSPHIGHO2_01_FULL_41_53 TaxID=1802663 RepID=A0A1F8EJX5_9BACT|nr:MAG: excinuclease ABC subunit B [Candidatus Yanofskybacteria bacterium RIFCSPHIGHO2_01_FULL_41_53]OGN12272.1 MAG: excinuclease ABC subunit B [Candidatus Yanofskybacteria bacterium RIFCSPHIGHO2_02_FULL_41_29]OGN23629.1 MAG: excinuclease ABC subunit B [Candidatus Yanofskybacteria bacterium RIFCSPLOWO2_01_FULL_41_67]OGN29384.1 MAG: excinuclease ABC subunit B [Candidatus Yanofskybacteria bacterium RIFCSPLOWO2_02_FULL_41_13]OGN33658.1 MAG: excinuclease ABC subunit B [Candidatus Yanofskybacteria b